MFNDGNNNVLIGHNSGSSHNSRARICTVPVDHYTQHAVSLSEKFCSFASSCFIENPKLDFGCTGSPSQQIFLVRTLGVMDPNLAPQNPRKSGVFTVNLHIKRAQTAFRQVYVNCHSLNFTIAKHDVFSPNFSCIYFIELTVCSVG